MAKNIFATSWHTGGANAIAPVIRRLGEDGKVHLNVLGYDASEDVFRRAGVEYRRLGDYGLHDVSPHSARIMLLVHQPGLVLTGKSIQNKRENLRTVLEQSMAVAAKEIGIPTVAVTDFWTGNRECFSDVFTGELFAYLPDRVTAIDRHAKEDMLREGFPEERIVVTGNPHFDDLIDLREGFTEEDRRQVRRDLGLGENSYVIMFASQYIESHYGNSLGYTEKTVLRDIFEALQQIDKPQRGREVLVKAHPTRENEGELRAVCSGFGEGFVVVKKYDPRRAFMASDLVLTPFSTVATEALYCGKPVISVQPGLVGEDFLITNKLGVNPVVYRKEDLKPALERAMNDPAYQEEMARMREGFVPEGRATERVTRLAYEMLNA